MKGYLVEKETMSKRIKMAILWAAILFMQLIIIGPAQAAGQRISFDFARGSASKDNYSKSLKSLRDELKDPNLIICKIPTLPQNPQPPPFTYVDLKLKLEGRPKPDQIITITLAIRKSDSYVVGYLDQLDGKPRAHIFKNDVPEKERKDLFPEAVGETYRLLIEYGSDYPSLESKAKVQSRKDVLLGIGKLAEYAQQIYGKSTIVEKDEAKFLIAVAQMVAEATRFKYIEQQIRNNFDKQGGYEPNPKFLDLENKWGKISEGIHKSAELKDEKKCKETPNAIELKNERGEVEKVKDVQKLALDIALLKAKNSKISSSTHFEQIISSVSDKLGDHDDHHDRVLTSPY